MDNGPTKEHGMLLSAPMVRALAAGHKTETRRIIAPHNSLVDGRGISAKHWNALGFRDLEMHEGPCLHAFSPITGKTHHITPRVCAGDTIWWKETWAEAECDSGPIIAYRANGQHLHCADGDKRMGTWRNYLGPAIDDDAYQVDRWKSSMFMPRWAARYSNTVLRVIGEQVQDISAFDALAEGIATTEHWTPKELDGRPFEEKWWDDFEFFSRYPQMAFKRLWNSINEERGHGWDANPWVWAYKLDRLVEIGMNKHLGRMVVMPQATPC